ncbi:hypothetical protein HKCCSP123_14160 [Rhodobacterales bacterium HKCCSP123]|nr:hypothetical protein [Rhodobacterales bacterium HKCCSP123]
MFWDGEEIGPIELASLISFMRLAIPVTVFSYQKVRNIPAGIALEDARAVYDVGHVVRYHKSGSASLHSNLFRYQMLSKTDLTWSDIDIIAISPNGWDEARQYGFQDEVSVGSSVLRLPAESPALRFLLQFGPDYRGVPPHLTGARRMKYQLRSLLMGGMPITRWNWGSLGPVGLTHALKLTGEISSAAPVECYYPVPLGDAGRLVAPDALTAGDLPQGTRAVHLWGSRLDKIIKGEHGGMIPKRSFLGQILDT